MRYKNVIFDLDGTLFETGQSIVKCLKKTFAELGKETPTDEELYSFVGPSLYDSFVSVGHFTPSLALKAVDIYRQRYLGESIFDCVMYDGVEEMLEVLKSSGVLISLASSKPLTSVLKVLTHFNIIKYFDKVSAPDFGETSSDKTQLVKNAILGGNCVMVGDRKYDIYGAQNIGIDTILVTYGYASKEELEFLAPTFKADSPKEVTKILLARG